MKGKTSALNHWLIDREYATAHGAELELMARQQFSNPNALLAMRREKGVIEANRVQPPVRAAVVGETQLFNVSPYTTIDRLPDATIVVVDVCGPITKYGTWSTWGCVEYQDLLFRLASSSRVKGIILNIDSPGGMVAGVSDLAYAVSYVAYLKPVYGIVSDGLFASAAIWAFSGCRMLLATQNTCQIGSIGVVATFLDTTEYDKMNGFKVHEVYAPQSVDKNDDVNRLIENNDDSLIKAELKVICDAFITTVKTSRGNKLKPTGDEPFTGKLYFANEAKKLGLIDMITPTAMDYCVQRINQFSSLKN